MQEAWLNKVLILIELRLPYNKQYIMKKITGDVTSAIEGECLALLEDEQYCGHVSLAQYSWRIYRNTPA